MKNILINLYNNMYTFVEKIKSKTKETIMKKIQENNIHENCFILINTYAMQKEKVICLLKKIYDFDPNLKNLIDNMVYFVKYVYCLVFNQNIEPMNNNWICTSVLMKQSSKLIGDQYYFNETYEFINIDNILEPLKETSDNITSIVESCDNIIEGMITMKNGNQYINRIFVNKNEAKIETELPLVPSKHRFISVKYTHPNMDEHVFIDIDSGYYYANNEILSPLFIKRYLEYQPLIYEFDMNYELEVMDNDINTYVINSKQYILLADSTYTIKNIE